MQQDRERVSAPAAFGERPVPRHRSSAVPLLFRRLRDEADFARAGALQEGHGANDFSVGHAVVATHENRGLWRAAQNCRRLRFDLRGIEGFILSLL